MWPFDDPIHQIPSGANAPKLGCAPIGDAKDLKLLELEQRLLGLECAVIEICKIVAVHQELCAKNFSVLEQSFLNLAHYVMQPRASILGEQKESN